MTETHKCRLYPTKTQERKLDNTLNTCRHLYNDALQQRIEKYKAEKKSLSYYDQCKWLTENNNEYRMEVYSQVLQNVLKRVDTAYKNFFRGFKSKKRVGYPRFKNKERYRSFCYPQLGFKMLDNNRIRLSKIGDVPIVISRPIEGKVKTCTIVKEVDQWYATLTVETSSAVSIKNDKPMIGIDVGISNLITVSDGSVIENPRTLRKSERKLAREQRRLSRKKKGSKRRNKQRVKVAKAHRKIRRQRDDYCHKTTTSLVEKSSTIACEDLNIQGMCKNRSLAKHIHDAGWGKLITFLEYKTQSAGGRVIKVPPKNTSQQCSGCGTIVQKELQDRVHNCTKCGLVIDRDHNAAINIKNRGEAILAKQAQGDKCT